MAEWIDKTINASDLIQWIVEHDEQFYKGSAKAIIEHIFELLDDSNET